MGRSGWRQRHVCLPQGGRGCWECFDRPQREPQWAAGRVNWLVKGHSAAPVQGPLNSWDAAGPSRPHGCSSTVTRPSVRDPATSVLGRQAWKPPAPSRRNHSFGLCGPACSLGCGQHSAWGLGGGRVRPGWGRQSARMMVSGISCDQRRCRRVADVVLVRVRRGWRHF